MWRVALGVSLAALLLTSASLAQESARLYNLKTTTDKADDLSSVDEFLDDAIEPGMTDEQKCMAVWEMVYLNRFWNPSTRCALRNELGGVDPMIQVHCFAPTICQEDAEVAIAFWGKLGYSTRMWQLGWHTTPEVYYGGRWRHFDPTLGVITRDEFGEVDSVTTRTDYWRPEQWGTSCPWYGPSAYVSHTEGYIIGHEMGLMLRRGESLVRYWYPLSLDLDYYSPGNNGARPCDRGPTDGYDKTYLEMAMELADWRFEMLPYDAAYANGVWVYEPDFARPDWADMLEQTENLDASTGAGGQPYLHPSTAGQPSRGIFRIKSPYVLTGGWITGRFFCETSQEVIRLFVSTDCGNTWDMIYTKTDAGEQSASIPLVGSINSKFDCLVRLELLTASHPESVTVEQLRFEVNQQNSPFPLPPLKLGDNSVEVTVGEQLDRLTIKPPLDSPDYRDYIISESNIVTAREAGQSSWVHGICAATAGQESYLIFRVDTIGQMQRLRVGGRFADDNTNNKMYYSYNGSDWTEMPWTYGYAVENTENSARTRIGNWETLDSIAPGTQTIWVKYWFFRSAGQSGSALQLMEGLRIDADYTPPSSGPVPPVEVTYCWTEFNAGQETIKTHNHTVSTYPTSYDITVGGDSEPIMKWYKVAYANAPSPWPEVDAGQGQTIILPEDTAYLAGFTTDDGLPDPPGSVSTVWALYSGPEPVAFADEHALDTAVTFSGPGTYVFRLTADDGLYQPYDDVTITVTYADTNGGLFSHYPFDEGAEDVVGANDGTLNNGAAVVSDGQRGNVLELDGSDDYVDLPSHSMTSGRLEVTLTMWVNPDEWVSSNTIYDEYGGDWGEYWQFSILEGNWYTRDASTGSMGGRDNDISVPAPGTGQWHHLAFVYSVSEGIKATYLDGQVHSSTEVSVDPLTTSRAGARLGYPCDGNYYDGLIDDVRFYDRALSDTEIGALAEKIFQLAVRGGSGGGMYAEGEVVTVAGVAPSTAYVFEGWIGDTSVLSDSGAAETTVTMPAAAVEVTAVYGLRVDLSGDGFVGQADLDIVLAKWGWTVDPSDPADCSGDGFVGQADLDMLLEDWGEGELP